MKLHKKISIMAMALMGQVAAADDAMNIDTGDVYDSTTYSISSESQKSLFGPGNNPGAIHFTTYIASTMTPIYSNNTYDYDNAGCTSGDGSTAYLDHSLDLPVGSRVVSLGLLYKDSNNGAMDLKLYAFDALGAFNLLSEVDAPAVAGNSSEGEFTSLPLTSGNKYGLRLSMIGTSASPCLVRIGYIPPSLDSDVIFATKLEY